MTPAPHDDSKAADAVDFAGTDLEAVLRETFGFDTFRAGQREAIETLLGPSGRLISIQPTGHGKSLLYQLPATLFEGMTLVLSPLLALMRDQIGQLGERFGISSAAINSDQSDEQNDAAREGARTGDVRILFVAPEQLDRIDTYELLVSLPIDLLVVDEAHCISTWGHDFRPSYRQIIRAVRDLEQRRPSVRVLGLTATANERTEADILAQFQGEAGRDVPVHRASMDRSNLSLRVIRVRGLDHKLATVDELLRGLSGCGLLYCATREQTEIVAGYLAAAGHDVVAYHAGLDPDRKRELQLAFTRGEQAVIAATNALGMGIDKADVRFIVHVDVPGSITSYYQEVGRSGRDGEPAVGVLLFDERDRDVQDYFIRSAQPSPDEFAAVLEATEEREGEEPPYPTRSGVAVRTGLHPTKVVVILAELVEQGFVEKQRAGKSQVYVRTRSDGAPDLSRYERQLAVRTAELEAILAYGRGEPECFMQALRVALGDAEASACGRCSACAPDAHVDAEITEERQAEARTWVIRRELPIAATRVPKMSAGFTLLDGEVRSPQFVDFMRHRTDPERTGLATDLDTILVARLDALASAYDFAAVALVPSRTWAQRESLGERIAAHLGIPLASDLLMYAEEPPSRQGELRNNDQRRENVRGCFAVGAPASPGPLLLVDDYIGSGATLKEAVRTLRKVGGFEGEIVPLTAARVRWKLGAPGMI